MKRPKTTMKCGMALMGALVVLGTGCQKLRKAMEEASRKSSETSASTAANGNAEVRHLVGASEFNSFVDQKGKVVVIDFYADWCPPCRKLGPILEKVAGEFGSQVALGKVNVDKNLELAGKWRISSIPDVRIFRDGKQVDAFMGLVPEAKVRQVIERQVSNLPSAQDGDPPASGTPDPKSGEAKKEPPITPMKKDWVPPGVERR